MAYAARFLIRMASLVPDGVNLRQIGRDVEKITIILTQGMSPRFRYYDSLEDPRGKRGVELIRSVIPVVPGFQFAHLLSNIITRARRQNVLPPLTRPPSPLHSGHPTNHPFQLSTIINTPTSQPPSSASGINTIPEFNFDLDHTPLSNADSVGAGSGLGENGFDFQFAEQLFSEPSSRVGNGFGGVVQAGNGQGTGVFNVSLCHTSRHL